MTSRTESPRRRRPYAARASIEDRRVQLLDAALAVILRDGFDKVSIDAIAREAGVTRPVVYGAFDGLGDLLGSLLDRQQARALEQLTPLLSTETEAGVRELVPSMARSLAETVMNDPETWRPILLTPQGMPEVVRTRIDSDRERVRGHIALLIEAVLGSLKGSADADILAHAVLAILEHFGRLLIEDPERFSVDQLVDTVSAVLDSMLGPNAPTEG